MSKEFVAHRGGRLTLEWYFESNGNSKPLEYFEDLPFESKKKFAYLFTQLGERGKIFNKEKFRNEGDKIYALKASQDRFLCFFFDGAKLIITNGYKKKSAKIPQREKERALHAKSLYEKRCKEGTYYE